MKKLVILIIVIAAIGWALQNYTDFKAMDYVKTYWQKIDWSKINIFGDNKTTPDPDKQLNIFIRDGKFLPSLSAIRAGVKVTWFNEDDKAHTATGESWGSEEIAPGKAWSKVFDTAENYEYHCSLHPSMTGEIIVR